MDGSSRYQPQLSLKQRNKIDTEHAPTKRVDDCNTSAQRMDRHKRDWGQNRNSKQKRLTRDERDMTLRPKIRATSSQTNNEKDKRDRTKLPDAHLHLVKNDYLAEIIPGVILLNNGSQQNQCLVQQV